jgi:hypothetical protein
VTGELSQNNVCPFFCTEFAEGVPLLGGAALGGAASSSGLPSTKPSNSSGNRIASPGALRSEPFAAETTVAPDAVGNDTRNPMDAAAGGARDCTPREMQIAGQTASVRFQRVDSGVRANELPQIAEAAWNCRGRHRSLISYRLRSFRFERFTSPITIGALRASSRDVWIQ